jgi:hypothetical protein
MTETDWIVLAASAAVVLFMIGVAALLGFRQTARLDDAELARLAAGEGARIEAAIIDTLGRGAVARLADGGVLIARVMADGVSVRVAPAGTLSFNLERNGLRVTFADLGFAPLTLRFASEAPDWVRRLVAGEKP